MKQIGYTVGHTESYNTSLKDHPQDSYKMGLRHNYPGGAVWKTVEEANSFLHSETFKIMCEKEGKSRTPKDFSVYAVVLEQGWDKDVNEKKEPEYHTLKNDCQFYAID